MRHIFYTLIFIFCSTTSVLSADELKGGDAEDLTGADMYEYDVASRKASCHTSVKENSQFRKKFGEVWTQCAPGCSTPTLEILPSANHCKNKTPSCHHTGNAADIRKVKCNGRTYDASSEAGLRKFDTIVACFSRKSWKTYWRDPKHYRHFHVEPGDCTKKKGCCPTVACLD